MIASFPAKKKKDNVCFDVKQIFIQELCQPYLRGRNLSFPCRRISARQLMHLSAGRLIILDITLRQERQQGGRKEESTVGLIVS